MTLNVVYISLFLCIISMNVTPRYFSDILNDLLVLLLLLFFLEGYIFFFIIYFVSGLDHEISTFKAIKTILSPNLFPNLSLISKKNKIIIIKGDLKSWPAIWGKLGDL